MVEETTQKFNMSLATLMRIDEILKDLREDNNNGNVQLLQKNLNCLYKEIYPFLNKEERAECEMTMLSINENGCSITINDGITYSEDLPKLLNDFEFYLRDKLHVKGLLMAKGEDSRFVI